MAKTPDYKALIDVNTQSLTASACKYQTKSSPISGLGDLLATQFNNLVVGKVYSIDFNGYYDGFNSIASPQLGGAIKNGATIINGSTILEVTNNTVDGRGTLTYLKTFIASDTTLIFNVSDFQHIGSAVMEWTLTEINDTVVTTDFT